MSRFVQNLFSLESESRVGSDFFFLEELESRVGFDPNLESYVLKNFDMSFYRVNLKGKAKPEDRQEKLCSAKMVPKISQKFPELRLLPTLKIRSRAV